MSRLVLCVIAYVVGYESGNPQRIIGVALIAALVGLLYLSREVTR